MVMVNNIEKSYGKEKVLAGASLSLSGGKVGCVVGKNGSGKSTLLSIIAGVLNWDSGTVAIDSKRPVGYLPQDDFLFSQLTVQDNLEFWGACVNVRVGSGDFLETIHLFQLEDVLKKRVSKLSGGMRRRTAFATAMLGMPDLIILDEPFTGIDIVNRQEVLEYIPILAGSGRTIIYSSHNIDEIYGVANKLFIINRGVIKEIDINLYEKEELSAALTDYLKGE